MLQAWKQKKFRKLLWKCQHEFSWCFFSLLKCKGSLGLTPSLRAPDFKKLQVNQNKFPSVWFLNVLQGIAVTGVLIFALNTRSCSFHVQIKKANYYFSFLNNRQDSGWDWSCSLQAVERLLWSDSFPWDTCVIVPLHRHTQKPWNGLALCPVDAVEFKWDHPRLVSYLKEGPLLQRQEIRRPGTCCSVRARTTRWAVKCRLLPRLVLRRQHGGLQEPSPWPILHSCILPRVVESTKQAVCFV